MSEKQAKSPHRTEEIGAFMGWLKDFFNQFQLAWSLMMDRRVSIAAKFIPVLTMLYLLSPIDLLPDVMLGLGQLDDLAVLLIGMRIFIETCPPNIVAEYRHKAGTTENVWTPEDGWAQEEDDTIIDVEVEIPPEEEG